MEDRYKDLLNSLLSDIDEIDSEVVWQESEPEWWVQMMVLRRCTQERVDRLTQDT